ncbi:MAG: chemotaxis protein CheC [Halodesulfurarchaeum sp.]
MHVSLSSLGTFNRIGSAGAREAATALTTLTGLDTFVETTKIHFSHRSDAEPLLSDGERRVAISFDGALEGRAMLRFDSTCADLVLSNLEGAGPDPDAAYLDEVANIVTSHFIDGWAQTMDGTIDISTPVPLGDPSRIVPTDATDEETMFIFNSVIEVSTGHYCEFYLLPDTRTLLETLEEQATTGEEMAVGLEELNALLHLTVAGSEMVADSLEAMTGMETDVRVSQLDFVPIENVSNALGPEQYLGTVFELEGPMEGYLAVLFEETAAQEAVESMVPDATGDEALRQSALEELGNVTASGFVDGWANALGTTIDHSVPDVVDDMGRALLESIAVRLGQSQDFAYVFDVTVSAGEPFSSRVFAFPEEPGFRNVLASLDGDIDVTSVERL